MSSSTVSIKKENVIEAMVSWQGLSRLDENRIVPNQSFIGRSIEKMDMTQLNTFIGEATPQLQELITKSERLSEQLQTMMFCILIAGLVLAVVGFTMYAAGTPNHDVNIVSAGCTFQAAMLLLGFRKICPLIIDLYKRDKDRLTHIAIKLQQGSFVSTAPHTLTEWWNQTKS